jgi:hypothetical protein
MLSDEKVIASGKGFNHKNLRGIKTLSTVTFSLGVLNASLYLGMVNLIFIQRFGAATRRVSPIQSLHAISQSVPVTVQVRYTAGRTAAAPCATRRVDPIRTPYWSPAGSVAVSNTPNTMSNSPSILPSKTIKVRQSFLSCSNRFTARRGVRPQEINTPAYTSLLEGSETCDPSAKGSLSRRTLEREFN